MEYALSYSTPMDRGTVRKVEKSWNAGCAGYVCRDGVRARFPHRSANIRNLNETKIAPRNMIQYKAGQKGFCIVVSGMEYSRNMVKILAGPDDVRTMILPSVVRTIR